MASPGLIVAPEASGAQFNDLLSREAREEVAKTLRAHQRDRRDREIEETLERISMQLEADRLENWTNQYREGRWKAGTARKVDEQIARSALLSRRQELYSEFDAVFRHLTREDRKADDFLNCQDLAFVARHQSADCGTKICQPISCDFRGCPCCGQRKVQRLVDQYVERVSAIMSTAPWKKKGSLYVITLTTKANREFSLPGWNEMRSVLGAGSYVGKKEFTKNGRGWLFAMELGKRTGMVHLHWLVLAEKRKPFNPWPISIEALNETWREACERFGFPGEGGFGFIEQVTPRKGAIRDQVAHVVKYVGKPMSFDPKRYAELWLKVPSSARFVRSGGVFHSGRKPTIRNALVEMIFEGSVPEHFSFELPTFCERVKSRHWMNFNKSLANARRAELDLLFKKPFLTEHRCPNCDDLLFLDRCFVISRRSIEDSYMTMKECRPPPLF